MLKIEHIGIAVSDLEKAEKYIPFFLEVSHTNVRMSFLNMSPLLSSKPDRIKLNCWLLLMNAVPSINLLKKGEGIHHIAFAVDDIHAEMQRLKDEGFVLLNEEPKAGADNKWVCFVHPKTTNGVLVELCQEINENI